MTEANLTPEQRLAAIKAERASLAKAREARESAAAVLAEVEREAMALEADKAMAEAEEKYGASKIAAVHTDLGVVIVKRPHAALFKRFQDSGEATYLEFEKLVRPCVVYPDTTKLDRILDELPATMARLGSAVAILAGVRMKEAQGK
jgi:hypothetical protein